VWGLDRDGSACDVMVINGGMAQQRGTFYKLSNDISFKGSVYDGVRRCVSVSHVLAPRERLPAFTCSAGDLLPRDSYCVLINKPGNISRLCRVCLTAVNIGIITAALTLSAGTVCCIRLGNLISVSFSGEVKPLCCQ
jgi:hypothetical protein